MAQTVMTREEIQKTLGTPAGVSGQTAIRNLTKELVSRINAHYATDTFSVVDLRTETSAGQMMEFCRQGRTLTAAQIERLVADLAKAAQVHWAR